MSRFPPQLSSYLSIASYDIREEILLALPPKEIFRICSQIEEFEIVCSRETFWKRVWLKWVSPQLPDVRDSSIQEIIYRRVKEAERLTTYYLLNKGALEGILFYVIEALERGADVHFGKDSALRHAAFAGHLHIVKYLVEKGANISALDDEALREAASRGHLDIVKYLVEHGANISARQNKALRWAARGGHLDVVRYLVEHGANIFDKNNAALRRAAERGHFHVVDYLISLGADPRILDEIIPLTTDIMI
jgi:hypothetical protein